MVSEDGVDIEVDEVDPTPGSPVQGSTPKILGKEIGHQPFVPNTDGVGDLPRWGN